MEFVYEGKPVAIETLGQGKPLLVLHGWGSSGAVMKPLAAALKVNREIHLIDLPGFGHSPSPDRPWQIDDYADLVAAYIRQIGGPVDLLAHSFGGRITLKLCARPDSAELVNLILITGGAGMKPRRKPSFYLKKYTAKSLKAPLQLLPQPLRDAALTKLRASALWKALGSSDYQTLSGTMREIFVKTVSEYLEGCLPNVRQSTLLLWGVNDDATPLYQAERMRDAMPNAALVTIEYAGHYAFLDQPHKFKAIAEAFFNA